MTGVGFNPVAGVGVGGTATPGVPRIVGVVVGVAVPVGVGEGVAVLVGVGVPVGAGIGDPAMETMKSIASPSNRSAKSQPAIPIVFFCMVILPNARAPKQVRRLRQASRGRV